RTVKGREKVKTEINSAGSMRVDLMGPTVEFLTSPQEASIDFCVTARLAERFQRVFRHIHHHDHTIGQILSRGGNTSGGHTTTRDGRGSSALPDALPGCIREIWLLERDSRRKRCGWDSLVAASQFAPPELRSSTAARRIDPSGNFIVRLYL